MHGFFTELKEQRCSLTIPQCDSCGLYTSCITPKMRPTGKGRLGILIVAEAPGKSEDQQGEQLIGQAGQLLRTALQECGIDLDTDCWKTNAVICRPPKNASPTTKQIEYCRPNLVQTIEALKPRVIVLLGGVAIHSLIGMEWLDDIGSVGRWVGWTIPSYRWGAWICPTWHPSYLLREGAESKKDNPLWNWFIQHLQQPLKLGELPKKLDCDKQIRLLDSPQEAAYIIRKMIASGGCVAWDYETNMLKPDGKDARILSCSVCWQGKRTIAYPWHGEAITATGEMLRSGLLKIASNLKFEERWTWKEFGHGVRNWHWDTMQAAHVLDNRRHITSVKFQAYVRLGVPTYDAAVKPFIGAKGSGVSNQLHRVPTVKLLRYNAMDSVVEYAVAEHQRREFGIMEDVLCQK